MPLKIPTKFPGGGLTNRKRASTLDSSFDEISILENNSDSNFDDVDDSDESSDDDIPSFFGDTEDTIYQQIRPSQIKTSQMLEIGCIDLKIHSCSDLSYRDVYLTIKASDWEKTLSPTQKSKNPQFNFAESIPIYNSFSEIEIQLFCRNLLSSDTHLGSVKFPVSILESLPKQHGKFNILIQKESDLVCQILSKVGAANQNPISSYFLPHHLPLQDCHHRASRMVHGKAEALTHDDIFFIESNSLHSTSARIRYDPQFRNVTNSFLQQGYKDISPYLEELYVNPNSIFVKSFRELGFDSSHFLSKFDDSLFVFGNIALPFPVKHSLFQLGNPIHIPHIQFENPNLKKLQLWTSSVFYRLLRRVVQPFFRSINHHYLSNHHRKLLSSSNDLSSTINAYAQFSPKYRDMFVHFLSVQRHPLSSIFDPKEFLFAVPKLFNQYLATQSVINNQEIDYGGALIDSIQKSNKINKRNEFLVFWRNPQIYVSDIGSITLDIHFRVDKPKLFYSLVKTPFSEDQKPVRTNHKPPLDFGQLKKNGKRFGKALAPIGTIKSSIAYVLLWQNPPLTLLYFLLYQFLALYGLLIPFIPFGIAIVMMLKKASIDNPQNELFSRLGFSKPQYSWSTMFGFNHANQKLSKGMWWQVWWTKLPFSFKETVPTKLFSSELISSFSAIFTLKFITLVAALLTLLALIFLLPLGRLVLQYFVFAIVFISASFSLFSDSSRYFQNPFLRKIMLLLQENIFWTIMRIFQFFIGIFTRPTSFNTGISGIRDKFLNVIYQMYDILFQLMSHIKKDLPPRSHFPLVKIIHPKDSDSTNDPPLPNTFSILSNRASSRYYRSLNHHLLQIPFLKSIRRIYHNFRSGKLFVPDFPRPPMFLEEHVFDTTFSHWSDKTKKSHTNHSPRNLQLAIHEHLQALQYLIHLDNFSELHDIDIVYLFINTDETYESLLRRGTKYMLQRKLVTRKSTEKSSSLEQERGDNNSQGPNQINQSTQNKSTTGSMTISNNKSNSRNLSVSIESPPSPPSASPIENIKRSTQRHKRRKSLLKKPKQLFRRRSAEFSEDFVVVENDPYINAGKPKYYNQTKHLDSHGETDESSSSFNVSSSNSPDDSKTDPKSNVKKKKKQSTIQLIRDRLTSVQHKLLILSIQIEKISSLLLWRCDPIMTYSVVFLLFSLSVILLLTPSYVIFMAIGVILFFVLPFLALHPTVVRRSRERFFDPFYDLLPDSSEWETYQSNYTQLRNERCGELERRQQLWRVRFESGQILQPCNY